MNSILVLLDGQLDGCSDSRSFEYTYPYTKRTLIKRFLKDCHAVIKEGYLPDEYSQPSLTIILNGKQYSLDGSIQLYKLIDFFKLDSLHIHYISGIGEGYSRRNGITYFVNSNENAHSPHIHAKYQGETISISILDYSVKGKFKNSKKQTEAVNYVKENRESMIDFYNINTNGVIMSFKEVQEYEKRKVKA